MTPPTPRSSIVIREVGLRDGLQSIARVLPTAQKIEWIQQAYDCGLREIEVGSFVPARLLPQLADTAELVAFAKTLPSLWVSVLVPNLQGARAALASGAAHSRANVRKEPDEMVNELARICAARDASGSPALVEGGVGTAFGCTLQGHVAPAEVLRLLQAARDAGADRVSLADTVGYADPAAVQALFTQARQIALANVYAALQAGITRFDASLAGIGGCPHAPGASGNVATEDLAYMLASMGLPTGINLPRLLALRARVAAWLDGETLHGTLWRAGLPTTLLAADAPAERTAAA
jgi:hydroxymethylglutaryl-CoA lyase